MTRRAVVLAELLVAGVLTVVIVGAALGSLLWLQRGGQHQVQRAARELDFLATVQLLRSELAGVSPPAGDLTGLGPHQFRYRGTRATGLACGLAADGLVVASSSLRAMRFPAAGRDSVLWLRGDSAGTAWVIEPVAAPPRAATCPDGAPALLVPVPAGALARAVIPGPVLVVELMEARGYASGSDWWLGLRSVAAGEVIQPVTGPFSTGGVAFRYLDSLGAETADPGRVRRLAVHLVGRAGVEQAVGPAARAIGGNPRDSLDFDVPVRGLVR